MRYGAVKHILRHLGLATFLSLLATLASAAPAIVTTLPTTSTPWGFDGSAAVTFTGVSIGDCLAVWNMSARDSSTVEPNITASDGTNTYTKASYSVSQGVRQNREVYYRIASTSGSHTVTLTGTGTMLGHVVGTRITGSTCASADIAGTASNFGNTVSHTSSTLANSNGIYFALFATGVNGFDPPAGWTLVFGDPSNTSGEGERAGLYYRLTAANTALTANWGTLDSSDNWAAAIIGFATASGVTPTFSVSPAIGTRTTSTLPITATSTCTDCTFYGVAVVDGSGAPSCTQIKAGQNSSSTSAYSAFSAAMTASVQATGTFASYTDGTVRDGYFCMNSTGGGDSSVAAIADMYKIPAYTVTPFVSARSATTHTVSSTLDGAGTIYSVGCARGSTAPTIAQVKAGQCTGSVTALASANKSVTGADTLTLTYGTPLLVYDVYQSAVYGSQDSVRTDLTVEIAGAASGYTAPAALTSICTAAACPVKKYNDANATDLVTGDYFSCQNTTLPDVSVITWSLDGNFSYPGPAARQNFACKYYDLSAAGMFAGANPATYYVNNSVPVCSGTPSVPILRQFKRNLSISPFNLAINCIDGDADALTAAITSGTLNTGLSLNSSTTDITGTPTVEVEAGNVMTATLTDIAGDTANSTIKIAVADTLTVPSCTGMTAEACSAAIAVNGWITAIPSYAYSTTVDANYVISITPVAATEVEPFTTVAMLVSLGKFVTTPTVNGYSIAVDPDAAATLYGVSVTRHSAAPNCAQIQAHTDGSGNAALAFGSVPSVAGEQVTLNIAPVNVPRTDVYVVGKNASNVCSPVQSFIGILKSAPSGRQYISIDIPGAALIEPRLFLRDAVNDAIFRAAA